MAEEKTSPEERAITNRDGVDLTQLRAPKAMTPLERVQALVVAANNLLEARERYATKRQEARDRSGADRKG